MAFNKGTPLYKQVLQYPMQFGVGLKVLPTKGNLVYEYNPFRNYRLSQTEYLYKNKLYTPKELLSELGIEEITIKITEDTKKTIDIKDATNEQCLEYIKDNIKTWKNLVPEDQTDPTLIEEGELADFETNELTFDVNHPVNILPQYSYDNSVNLILNDGKNIPRLINSRFSATSRNQYQIVDRKGNNDTNIYDQGSQFDIDTSLYKRVIEIPRLHFVGLVSGGKLPIGNYHFYFRYSDADGNETDFVAESGLVSLFIGYSPSSIRSGFRNEDSHKGVQFILSNIDSSYQYVNVYYTKATSDIHQNPVVQVYKINQKFLVNNAMKCSIIITGYEDIEEVSIEEINPRYLLADSAQTQDTCQNMLFLGNIHKPDIPYQELEDLSLRFLPYVVESPYDLSIDAEYNISSVTQGYYDPKFIYNRVGYWNHEYYRFGIVYILSDSSLSPVFNIRGMENLKEESENKYSQIPMWLDQGDHSRGRNYIITEEDTYKIVTDSKSYREGVSIVPTDHNLENSKGVISLDMKAKSQQNIYGINVTASKEVIDYLKDTLKIKGFFFVRQKRIPTILCQAYTIGIDPESRTPVLPVSSNEYLAERFIDNDKILTHDFNSRKYFFQAESKVRKEGAICPEYDVDYPYYNTLFTGDSFSVCESDIQPSNPYLTDLGDRNFRADEGIQTTSKDKYNVKIIGVEDNTKLVAIGDKMFSARAGEAEEAFRFEYLEKENKVDSATNLVRGSFGPYLGIVGYPYSGRLIDIKIPGFFSMNQEDLFKIRYNDKSPFYAISERIALKEVEDFFQYLTNTLDDMVLGTPLYRGDCYICQVSHRVNRNFQDPSAPANDKIVDSTCWQKNFGFSDDVLKTENFEKINLGDVNAVQLGMWVTFTVRSTKNLNIRNIDDSIVDEVSLFGHARTFYPYGPMSPEGAYKIPEALCYNKGFEKSVSERYNIEVPDSPSIKNDFTNRIAYSDIHINDAFKNGFRVFQETHYRDYSKTYGSITKIIELRGKLVCVFEHGVALISVNERVVAGEGSGGNVYINTSNVLPENPKIISDTFGSQWRDSVIKTPQGIYGVDTVGKKIWRTNGTNFECISDFKVQEFLNQNISLSERELTPIMGVRNVKTHYNKFKHDVMFTFYDNLYGFEEKVWNLCYNELQQKWVTFYSWVPSYSENIYNQYFSFDRNTSKWITKLGVSKHGNSFSDGVTLGDNIITDSNWKTTLHLSNRNIPKGEGIICKVKYELVRDNYGNYKLFNDPVETDQIDKETGLSIWEISLRPKVTYENLCSEYYARIYKDCILNDLSVDKDGKEVLTAPLVSNLNTTVSLPEGQRTIWKKNLGKLKVYKNDRNRRINLVSRDKDRRVNGDKVVILLNIKATLETAYIGDKNITLGEAYANGSNDMTFVDSGYYQSVVAVIPKYNMQFLTTHFWRHGQAGIIDVADNIYPTYWYGKQHPFEFEFIVADNPQLHKIFDNLEIISNNAEPESFHYEIIGDCFSFSNDKKNMYIRQEATKELYQYNGSDVLFDPKYTQLESEHRRIYKIERGQKIDLGYYDKSTLFPLYYQRQDTINDIEDYYHLKDGSKQFKDFSALSGAEIVKYDNLQEYRIWNHAKAIDIMDPTKGRLRGNMQYKEDKWCVQINPINLVQKNEREWLDMNGNPTEKVPVELYQNPLPSDILDPYKLETPKSFDSNESSGGRGYVIWNWEESQNKEVKIKDKWVKIRIRYRGDKLAIITAIKTLYSASYA